MKNPVEPRGDAESWDGGKGELWVRRQRENDAFLQAFGEAALRAAAVAPGETAIDVGCGCGASTLALAAAVGERGRVVAVDLSRAMLDLARRRVTEAGFQDRVTFVCDDAAAHAFAPGFADVLFSRFGVMFFRDPVGAFANLRRAMKPSGRLAFVCWQSDADNEWKTVPYEAALTVLPRPAPRDPESPGGSSFASPARVTRILSGAGWHALRLEPFHARVTLGTTLDAAVDAVSETTLFGDLIATALEPLRERARAAAREALEPHLRGDGVALGAAAWIVRAQAAAG